MSVERQTYAVNFRERRDDYNILDPDRVVGCILEMQAFKNFRTYFFRGMAALLPTILTIWIFGKCYVFIQDKVSIHINRALVWLILRVTDQFSEEMLVNFWVLGPGKITGLVIAILGVVMVGAFLASVVGRTLWHLFEKTFMNIPLVKQVYPHIKQVTDFLLTKKDLSFSKVVAIEYPRKGTWSIGLVTGTGLKKVVTQEKQEFLTVFVPTSPTPFTGYVILVPKAEALDLDMTIEEAVRFVISGGVITPSAHLAFEASRRQGEEGGEPEGKPLIEQRRS